MESISKTQQQKMLEVDEYFDCLLTLQLAVAFSYLQETPVNKSIKMCCKTLLLRVRHKPAKTLLTGLIKQALPQGALSQVLRQVREVSSEG